MLLAPMAPPADCQVFPKSSDRLSPAEVAASRQLAPHAVRPRTSLPGDGVAIVQSNPSLVRSTCEPPMAANADSRSGTNCRTGMRRTGALTFSQFRPFSEAAYKPPIAAAMIFFLGG